MPTAGEGARKRVCSRTFVRCEITSQSNVYIEDRLREQEKDSHVHVLHHIIKQPKVVAIVGLQNGETQTASLAYIARQGRIEKWRQRLKKGLIRMTLLCHFVYFWAA